MIPGSLVSIVIPVFASSPHHVVLLEETLATVAAQAPPHEVVVVDDGSPCDVARAVRRFGATVLRQANAGCAQARNTGIAASRGDFFVFLDADDHLLPGALDAQLAAFAANPAAGFVVGGREEMTYEGGPVSWSVPPVPRETRLYHLLLSSEWFIIPPSTAMFRRAVVESLGGFRDPFGADDLDFYLRAARVFSAFCFDEPRVTRYRRYSASTSRDGERMLRSIRQVYARHLPLVADDPAGRDAHRRGLAYLEEIFRDCLVENVQDRVRAGQWRRALRAALLLARESPRRLRHAIS